MNPSIRIVIYVDERPLQLLPGMTIRHALMAAGLWPARETLQVWDEWGNEIGLEGAVRDGMAITTATRKIKEEGIEK